MESSKCGKQDLKMQRSFSRGGFQQNISSSHMVPPPFFSVSPSLSLLPPPPAPLPETALWLRCACRGVPFTWWVVHPDHDKHLLWSDGSWSWESPALANEPESDRPPPRPLPDSRSPCSKDRVEPEEGRGGWLVTNGPACHPRLGSFIVQEVIGGAQRPFGCDLNSE